MAYDGSLIFDARIDTSAFQKDISGLISIGTQAVTAITALFTASSAATIKVGSSFESSMSQVAATMGITSAAEEFETLSAAAKEMGETTKFSASQAGEALNYLALAGYDANKAVAALPTVLNVAAAGGIELASASDMITDAMSALGLETEQMADFADKLAVTAQKSNTSVAQLGEAILTVGGTAKMLSGGVTELNTALGILADNGIKGAEGGTALRNIITDIGGKTKPAREALEQLGVSAYDSNGKMRPLKDTFMDLKAALDELNNDQMETQLLTNIFGAMDLKAVNALLGTSSERFDELSGYIDNCSGAAEAMAKTMDDNLKGDLTILGSALEGLGIAAYEKFQEPMRTAVQEVTESVGGLTKSLTSGELSGSMDKIASGFGKLATSVMDFTADTAIPVVIDFFEFVADHGQAIITTTAGIGSAFAAWKVGAVVSEAVAAVQKLKAANEGATIAQIALNTAMEANPVGLVLAAVAGLTAGLIALGNAIDSAYASTEKYSESLKQAQKNEEALAESSEQNAAVIKRKADWYEELRQNENRTAAEEETLKKLAEELQEVIPDGISIIDEQTGAYKNLEGAIDGVIEKMRLQSILNAKKETYDTANANIFDFEEKQKEAEEYWRLQSEQFQKDWANGSEDGSLEKGKENFLSAYFSGEYQMDYQKVKAEIEKQRELRDEYEELYQSQFDKHDGKKLKPYGVALVEQYTAAYEAERAASETAAQALADEQAENTELLKEAWKKAEHDYAVGVITSERDLYAQKSALLEQYGNVDLEDHWKYYENLHKMENDFAKQSAEDAKKAADEAAEAREQQMSDEWNSIERMQSLGVISAEDAYKRQLAFIEKYCAEYSDEWYSYYQIVIEYQRQAQQEQVNAVKENISDLVSEYKSAYSDLDSDINSYKNRLMSVGDLFSVDTDENGNTIVSVENMRSQMAEMQKYHDYVSQLKAKGMSQAFFSEMASMDFEDSLFTAENLANMSDAEFKEINDLYAQKQELADKLANELYEPEMEQLNSDLVNGVIDEFDTLPAEIQAIGAEALQSFIDGLSAGDISENVNNFTEQFAADCKNGINKAFEKSELNFAALMESDSYSVGKSAGEDYVKGFNEAMEKLKSAAASEQYSVGKPQNTAGTASGQTAVIRNHIDLSVNMDGDKIAEKVIETENLIDYRKGE